MFRLFELGRLVRFFFFLWGGQDSKISLLEFQVWLVGMGLLKEDPGKFGFQHFLTRFIFTVVPLDF